MHWIAAACVVVLMVTGFYIGRPYFMTSGEASAHFLMGWVRTVEEDQPTQTILTFNPPTTSEGRWVVDYFAPWWQKAIRKYARN